MPNVAPEIEGDKVFVKLHGLVMNAQIESLLAIDHYFYNEKPTLCDFSSAQMNVRLSSCCSQKAVCIRVWTLCLKKKKSRPALMASLCERYLHCTLVKISNHEN